MTFRFHRRLIFWNIVILLVVILIDGFDWQLSFFALAAGILLTLVVSYALKQRVVVPLSDLLSMIQKIGEGELHQRVPVKGDTEVAELLRIANGMARNLDEREKLLLEAQTKADSSLEAMTEGV